MAMFIFYVCAVAVIAGALGVVLANSPVHSALFLLLTLVSVAVLFLQQGAALVAIIQIVVYASAIVVLFVFVIALLGVDSQETLDEPIRLQRPIALILGGLLFIQIVVLAGRQWVTGERSVQGELSPPRSGNVREIAESLFTDYVWAFEITAVLLVIAVVGGVALARRSGQRPQNPSAARSSTPPRPAGGEPGGAGGEPGGGVSS